MNRTAVILLTCLALASCAPAGRGGGSGDARLRTACTHAADRVYDVQHRGDIFAPISGVNSPQSGNYVSSADGKDLSQLFDRDNDIDNCVRRNGLPANQPVPPPAAH